MCGVPYAIRLKAFRVNSYRGTSRAARAALHGEAPWGVASVPPRNASCAAYTALCPSLPFKSLMDSWFFNSNINGLQIEAMPERQFDYANKHTPFLP